jgi:hypothetical protein
MEQLKSMFNLSETPVAAVSEKQNHEAKPVHNDDRIHRVVGPLTTTVNPEKVGGKKYSKRKTYKRKVTTAAPSKKFVWRFIIVNGIVKKLKMGKNRKFRGGNSEPLPITSDNDLTQYLLLQPDKPLTSSNATAIEKYANNSIQVSQSPTQIRGGYCGCNKNRGGTAGVAYDSNNNLLTQASMGGKAKKTVKSSNGGDYKKKLEKLSVDKLKKIAANKHIKITKKKNGVVVYIKKSSIIKKLCEHKK